MGATLRGQARSESVGAERGRAIARNAGKLHGQDIVKGTVAVPSAGERQVAAHHGQGAARLDVSAHAGQVGFDPIGLEIEVVEDEQVERLELFVEDFLVRKRDEGHLVRTHGHIVGVGAQDEERDQIDVGVEAQHRAQETFVPRWAAAYVQDTDAVADDLEGEGLAVVAVQRLAGQHGRSDLEHVVARLVGGVVEDHACLRRILAQDHRLGVDQAPVA